MPISSTQRKVGPTPGNGTSRDFPFTFKVFDPSQVEVIRTSANGGDVALTQPTDYVVTLNPDQNAQPGGTVRLSTALGVGLSLTILSAVPITQLSNWQSQGGFNPDDLDDDLDRQTAVSQQLAERLDRTLVVPATVSDEPIQMAKPVGDALLAWSADGTRVINVDPASLASHAAYSSSEFDVFTGDGVETIFNLSLDAGSLANLRVSIAGVAQTPGEDFQWNGGTEVEFSEPPANGLKIVIQYFAVMASSAELNTAVEEAQQAAEAAAANGAAAGSAAGAMAGTTAGTTAGAASGATAGTTAGTAAANAVVATKLNTDGSNPTNKDTVKSNLDVISFKIGPTAITGSRFGANWMLQLGADDGSFQGGQWPGQTNAGTIVSKSFTAANTNVTTEVPLPGFLSTVFVDGLGYNGDGVAVMGIATAKQTGDTVFGANFIAAGATGKTNNKLVGMELDIQFPPGSTAGAGSSGLYINTFGATDTGDAIQINAHGGYWANGIKIGGINPTLGAGLSAVVGQTLGSLINTRSGSYGGVAIELGDTASRGIRLQGPAGDNSDAAQIFNSGGFLIIRGGNQPIVFQRHDTTNTLLIESGGSLDLTAASTVYKAQGVQVVGARKTGWAADTGTAKRTANATYSGTAEAAYTQATMQALMNAVRDLTQTVKALKDDLISHGLIGS